MKLIKMIPVYNMIGMLVIPSGAFVVPTAVSRTETFHWTERVTTPLSLAAAASSSTTSDKDRQHQIKRKSLGLLTFDLDDTLFDTGAVVKDANAAMTQEMERLGYSFDNNNNNNKGGDANPTQQLMKAMKAVKAEANGPITYTEQRKKAIARLMRDSFVTTSSSGGGGGVEKNEDQEETMLLLESWSEQVFEAWLHERHRASERYLFAHATEALEKIQSQHPGACIGAVTNGRGDPRHINPLKPYFSFCVSGEDDHVFPHRKPHRGIYDATLDLYRSKYRGKEKEEEEEEGVWIHVGDCLANDIGGSVACGAKAIWYDPTEMEEDENNNVFVDIDAAKPFYSTASSKDLEVRRKLAEEGRQVMSARVESLLELPDAIMDILLSC